MLGAVPAVGDTIANDISATGANVVTYAGTDVTTTINFKITATGGNPAVCDVSAGNPTVLSIALETAPGANTVQADVSVSPSTITMTSCGTNYPAVFTVKSLGKKKVTITRSGVTVNGNLDFTLESNAPTNTAPTVSVAGFVDGAPYEYPAAPTPTCDVNDAEDVGEAASPVTTGPVGPHAALGLGTYTVTCSYTDTGSPALSDSDTKTYTRNDTTYPTLNTPGDQSLEATGPGGAAATWAVDGSDALGLAGPATCDVPSGTTFDLGVHTVNCSVTDLVGLTTEDSFTVTVTDETAPSIVAPNDPEPFEATGAAGAAVTYPAPTATDLYDPDPVVTCSPESGTTFTLGTTTVTCSATDSEGNTSGDVTFDVTVVDSTPPTVADHDPESAEATGPDGAAVTFTDPTATDLVDGTTEVTCEPASGSTFGLGTTTVTCSSTDAAGNTGTNSFTVTVVDTIPPAIEAHDDVTAEATGPSGASVVYTTPGATDIVDGTVPVGCIPSSPALVAVGGSQLVTCSATDAAGNAAESSFTLYVVDTTAPVIDPHADLTVEATGPSGAAVSYTNPGATDLVDGAVATDCTPASGVLVAVDGSQLVTCTATDAAGNSSQGTFTLSVEDTTAPSLNLPGNINAQATSASGAVVTYTATATDLVDGSVPPDCTPASGSTFAPGTTTVSCTATDAHDNTSAAQTFTVTVSFTFNGFFAPVDNGGVLNTIKGGQSVPMKWAIPNGSGGFVSSLAVVSKVGQVQFTCTASAPTDDVEATSTGGTSLRYDTTANQYIYNWQSPKGAGNCYKVTVHLTDGSSKSALFKTK